MTVKFPPMRCVLFSVRTKESHEDKAEYTCSFSPNTEKNVFFCSTSCFVTQIKCLFLISHCRRGFRDRCDLSFWGEQKPSASKGNCDRPCSKAQVSFVFCL